MTAARYRHPLQLYHSWPLFERARHFELGQVEPGSVAARAFPEFGAAEAALRGERRIGVWQCDLGNGELRWSSAVYDMFGIERGHQPARSQAVARYVDASRHAMERLRDYAITHQRGFTLDVEIQPGGCRRTWIRLMAAPVVVDGRVVALHGLKRLLGREG